MYLGNIAYMKTARKTRNLTIRVKFLGSANFSCNSFVQQYSFYLQQTPVIHLFYLTTHYIIPSEILQRIVQQLENLTYYLSCIQHRLIGILIAFYIHLGFILYFAQETSIYPSAHQFVNIDNTTSLGLKMLMFLVDILIRKPLGKILSSLSDTTFVASENLSQFF